MTQYSADFETTTDPDDCRVWAWCVSEIGNEDATFYGTGIDGFMEFCEARGGVYWFHNAGFDCEFILHWLLTHGFKHADKLATRKFKTLISATGKFYQMEVCFEKKGKKRVKSATFKDSLKKFPMKVSQVAKAFDLPISKLEIDYAERREIGHRLTAQERDYIRNDVLIVSKALEHQFAQGLVKLTVGADALAWYKAMIGSKWDDWFPKLTLETDAMVRKAYRGGYTYANPKHQADAKHPDRINGAGSVYDVNSLYPDVMYNRPLPIGQPVWFRGRYEEDAQHPLFIQFITCHCRIKPDRLPTLQIKNNPYYSETEYVLDTEGTVELALTNVDMEMLFQQYDVDVLAWNGGYKFEQATGLFRGYIDHWMHVKENSAGGLRQLAKLMLNSLYGKFATNPDVTPKVPYLKDDGSVGYKLGDKETCDPVYTALGCFVTAWARHKTINAAQAVYDRFMYADTDSLHVLGTEPVEGLEVHPTHLGAWKHESDFSMAKYVRAKTYMERVVKVGKMVDGVYRMVPVEPYDDVKCAGMPEDLKRQVTFETFKRGLSLFGKLKPKHVPGGVVLVPTAFTLT